MIDHGDRRFDAGGIELLLRLLLLSIAVCGEPARAQLRLAAVEAVVNPRIAAARCGDGSHPIEILAADVAIVIDRSTSTREPTGIDLDGNGIVGEFRHAEYTDRGDSYLSAQLGAVARLVEVARLGGMRFAIVSFSGRDYDPLEEPVGHRVDPRDARVEAALTDDVATLDRALVKIARRGSAGTPRFAPAMRLGLQSLRRSDSDAPGRRRRALLLADTAVPFRFAAGERIAQDDERIEVEARRAIAQGIRFHSFGIGSAVEAPPRFALAAIAGATGGIYRAVPDPRDLYCQLLAALRS